jgi:hypothetical protein
MRRKAACCLPLIVNLFWPAPAHGKFNGSFFRMLIRLQRCWARADKRREKTRRWKLAYSSETKNLIVPNSVLCHCCARLKIYMKNRVAVAYTHGRCCCSVFMQSPPHPSLPAQCRAALTHTQHIRVVQIINSITRIPPWAQ